MNIENVNLTEELILKAGECKTSEELLALARENGITITMEQLPELMAEVAKKCSGEISDDALEAASAVGGKASYTDKGGEKYKVVTVGYWCRNYSCKVCEAGFDGRSFVIHNHDSCPLTDFAHDCNRCLYMVRKDGLWLCGYGNNFIV